MPHILVLPALPVHKTVQADQSGQTNHKPDSDVQASRPAKVPKGEVTEY